MIKYFFYLCFFISSFARAELSLEESINIVKVYTTLTPNAGSFVATSDKARGRLLKTGPLYTADRISVFANSFTTENSVRDKHFSEYIAGGEKLPHPRIDILELKGESNKATAKLVINGITKDIELTYIERSDHVEAEFKMKTSDFNLPSASFLGVKVSEDVRITAKYYWEAK